MRITNKLMSDSAIYQMEDGLQKMYALQEKISSTKQFQRSSEKPSTVAAIMNMRSTLEVSQGYLNTTKSTDDWMTMTDYSLRQMIDTGKRALSLVQNGVSDTIGAEQRGALGVEMDVILNQAVDIANTSQNGSFLFAGYKTTIASTTSPANPALDNPKGVPFTITTDASGTNVYYHGDNGSIMRSVGPGQTIAQNISGSTFVPAAGNPSPNDYIFNAIIKARDDLKANDTTALQDDMVNLNNALKGLNDSATTNGARQRQVKVIADRLDKTQTELKSLLSQKEDTNMAEAISNLRLQETTYQTVLEVGIRAFSAMNLFDKLG